MLTIQKLVDPSYGLIDVPIGYVYQSLTAWTFHSVTSQTLLPVAARMIGR